MVESPAVRVTRTVPAPREEVYRARTDPERLAEWFGPGAFTGLDKLVRRFAGAPVGAAGEEETCPWPSTR